MVMKPSTTDSIYEDLKQGLSNKIAKLTNFTPTSFNRLWLKNAFSAYIRELEIATLAVQLSGWVDYAGKELTQEDLDALGIEGVEPEEVNRYVEDDHLDELGKIVGVTRNFGEKAEGEVTVMTTSDTVTIPKNTEFGTQPNANGVYYAFKTTEEASPAPSETQVTIPVVAAEAGSAYNVGSGTITYMPNAVIGVASVSNATSMSGGVDAQSNAELRQTIKNSIFENSGGGTVKGVAGYVRTNAEGVNSVSVEEFTDTSPPYVDVIVEGGEDAIVDEAIDASRPVGIRHNLVRPTDYQVNVYADVLGGAVDEVAVENAVTAYIVNLPLGGSIVRDKLIQTIMNADSDIERIDTLYVEVNNEAHTFTSGTTTYALDKGAGLAADGIVDVTGVLNGASHTFGEGSDYEESADGIEWIGEMPDDGTEFTVTYRIDGDLEIAPREKSEAATITVEV